MLLANETVATHLESLRVPCLYRIHDEPKATKLEEFADLAESFGFSFSFQGPVPQRGFQHLLRDIKGAKEERTLSRLMLRSMERARYSAQNKGHFGLAMATYAHFTSPIRRYPDLVVHRILREVLDHGRQSAPGGDSSLPAELSRKDALGKVSWQVFDDSLDTELRSGLDAMAEHTSERERAAEDAERELIDWRKSEFMAGQIGNVFEAVITGVKDYGFWVELDEHLIEGLVHVSTLADDTYVYDERKHWLRGEQSGMRLRVGDRVEVAVDRVDRSRHTIFFSISRSRRQRED
jgi:ribonuclease R